MVINDTSEPQRRPESSSLSQYCTCNYPESNEFCVTFERAVASSSSSWCLWTVSSNEDAQRLRRACQEWGFCHVRIPRLQAEGKAQVAASLFDAERVAKSSNVTAVTFRGRYSESGSAQDQAGSGEPKESWEHHRRRRRQQPHGDHQDAVLKQMESWTQELHSVAVAVARTLFGGDDKKENEWWKYIVDAEQEAPARESGSEESFVSPDLLRVFCYDPVFPALGSSPHTDWGSLTVVWQSSKGLQVYCPQKQVWNDIPCPDPLEKYETFVVHIGDFVSLATGQSPYPSPRHQVVCPSTHNRLSLVYFVYPPRGVTLEQAQDAWNKDHPKKDGDTRRLDCDVYSLLHNQSTTSNGHDTCQEEYQRIRKLPFDQVIQAKWKQVQRG